MLRLESTKTTFKLYFKDFLLLKHEPAKPCLSIGTGEGSINTRKKHAGFNDPKEKNLQMHDLIEFKINEQSSAEISIEFPPDLSIKFVAVDGRLEIGIQQSSNADYNRFTIRLPATREEKIYGLGEQFNFLNMRKKKVPLLTSEPGFGRNLFSLVGFLAELLRGACGSKFHNYFPQPTFISTRNYFVHINSYAYSILDFTENSVHCLHFWEVPGSILIGKEDSALEVISSLSNYLGKQPELPDWAISGMWLGIGGGIGEDYHTVNSKLQRALDAGVKVTGIWSQDWSGLYLPSKLETRVFWDWIYDGDRYPNLPQIIKELHEKGVRFLGYNNSFLHEDGKLYKEAIENGYLIMDKDGNPYEMNVGGIAHFKVGYLDLTNPECWEWTKDWIKKNMLEIGLGGWMCDFAEYLPSDCKVYSGEDPEILHNKYPVLWAKVNAEACRELGKLGKDAGEDAVVFFSRSGNFGTQTQSPLIWAGDQFSNFSKDQGLPTVIIGGLALGFCGIGHYHSDIGGLWTVPSVKRTKEIWMRWTELSCFTPVMRSHEGHEYDKGVGHPIKGKNWKFDSDKETLDHLAKMTKVHEHIVPYVREMLDEYQKNGLPLMRHPYIHYEHDPTLHQKSVQYQFLYGRDLLVAPVIQKNKTLWKVYLPVDEWVHLWSGKRYKGGWHVVDAPLGEPPVFYLRSSPFKDLFEKVKKI